MVTIHFYVGQIYNKCVTFPPFWENITHISSQWFIKIHKLVTKSGSAPIASYHDEGQTIRRLAGGSRSG